MGQHPGHERFLKGEPQGKVNLGRIVTNSAGTLWQLWQMNEFGEAVTLKCIGDTGPNCYLDGHTLDGTVGLAPSSEGQFSGTHWLKARFPGTAVSLYCLGSAEGEKRFLDGITDTASVALAPNTAEPFSGTRWRIKPAGHWWVPCRFPAPSPAGPIRVVNTTRVGQLTGSADPQGRPLLNCDTAHWGVQGTDVGANAVHANDGRLYIFFGDVFGVGNPEGRPPLPDADLVAWTEATSADALVRGGPGSGPLRCAVQAVMDGRFFEPFRIGPASAHFPPIGALLTNEGPTGAFSFDGRMYVFVWIGENHHPAVHAGSHLVSKRDPARPGLYDYEFMLSEYPTPNSGFFQVAPVVVTNSDHPGLPSTRGQGLVILGQGDSKALKTDAFHLAWIPLTPGSKPSRHDILYYAGTQPNCQRWDANPDCAVSVLAQPTTNYTSVSAAWLEGPRRWILVYATSNDDIDVKGPIIARFSDDLTSWSDKVELFDPCRDGAYGADGYMHWPGLDDIPARVAPDFGESPANAYGAFLVNRFTQWDATRRELHLYYLMSLFRPYQVQLMHSTIRIA
jgi:hypothetical protein